MGMFFALVLLGIALIHTAAAQTAHVVGDTTGWSMPSDPSFYSTWAAAQTFNIGDSITFNFDSTHDVGEVTKAGYDACDSSTTIGASQPSSPVTITLTAPGLKYYICSFHCSSGQKLAITVLSAAVSPPPTAATSPPPPAAIAAPPPTSTTAAPPAIPTPPPTSVVGPPPSIPTPPPTAPPTTSTVPPPTSAIPPTALPPSSAIPPTASPPRSDDSPPTSSPPAPTVATPPSNSASPPKTSTVLPPSANGPSASSTSRGVVAAFSATLCIAVALFF